MGKVKKRKQVKRLNSRGRRVFGEMLKTLLPELLLGLPDEEEARGLVLSSRGTPELLRKCGAVLKRCGYVGDENRHLEEFLCGVGDVIEGVEKGKTGFEPLCHPWELVEWLAEYMEMALPASECSLLER